MSSKLMRCRACGLIMDEAHIGDVCPACGLKRTVFEEYTPKVSESRLRILGLNLHPIVLHFPQAFTAILPLLIIGAQLVGGDWAADLLSTAKILALLLPVTIAAAFVTGLVDGKARFKTISTPFLKRKMYYGIALFAAAVAMTGAVFLKGLDSEGAIIVVVLSLMCLTLQVLLGKIGGKLLNTIVNG
jgi:rubredoxin